MHKELKNVNVYCCPKNQVDVDIKTHGETWISSSYFFGSKKTLHCAELTAKMIDTLTYGAKKLWFLYHLMYILLLCNYKLQYLIMFLKAFSLENSTYKKNC